MCSMSRTETWVPSQPTPYGNFSHQRVKKNKDVEGEIQNSNPSTTPMPRDLPSSKVLEFECCPLPPFRLYHSRSPRLRLAEGDLVFETMEHPVQVLFIFSLEIAVIL